MASYSASLFDARNLNRMAYSSYSLLEDCSRSPTSDLDNREAPSTHKVHHFSLCDSPSRAGHWGDSTTKLAITCPFMDNLSRYSIPYSLNSMAHWSILPDISGLCRMLRRGRSVSMTTGWAWKYEQSLWVALHKAKTVCSIFEYLVSTSSIVLLT